MSTEMQRALDWITGEDTGLSSKTIFEVMTSAQPSPQRSWIGFYPLDPDDFGRCYRLLQRIPEWRERLPEVAARYPDWCGLVDAWDELTALYEQEVGTGADVRAHRGKMARRLYARMKEIEEQTRRHKRESGA